MSTPITWQNVTAPGNSEALRGMLLAQQGIGTGFDALGKVIQDRQQVNQNTLDTSRLGAQQSYLAMLDGAKTPEELAALNASGALEAQRTALHPAYQAQVLGAEQAKRNAFATQMRAQNEESRAAAAAPVELAARQAATAASTQQVTESQARVKTAETEAVSKNLDRLRTAVTSATEAIGKQDETVIGSASGIKSLTASLSSTIKDPKALTDAMTFVNTALASNPEFRNLPTDVIESIVMARADQYGRTLGTWDAPLVDYMKTSMAEALKTHAPRILANGVKRAQFAEQLQRANLDYDAAHAKAYPEQQAQIEEARKRAAAALQPATAGTPGAPAAAAPVPPVPVQSLAAQKERETSATQARIDTEIDGYKSGNIKKEDMSPDAVKYMESSTERDRAAIQNVGRTAGGVAAVFGSGAMDLMAAVPRGVANILDQGVRLNNALGGNLPRAPEAYTNFTYTLDRLRKENGGKYTTEDFKARLEAAKKAEKEMYQMR